MSEAQPNASQADLWSNGDQYESYTGYLSRRVAPKFLAWISPPGEGLHWCDLCCGTGALTSTVLERLNPASIDAVDASPAYLAYAKNTINDDRVTFHIENVEALTLPSDSFNILVSGLALNFLDNPREAAGHIKRVLKSKGIAAAYIWDFTEGMQMIRAFWDAALVVDPSSAQFDPVNRFALCQRDAFENLFREIGLMDVESTAIEVPANFQTLERYWDSFLTGQGTAPMYVASLEEAKRTELRNVLGERLPRDEGGQIRLTARAWAVKGLKR